MADIFISYSSKDREKAVQLTEMLSSAGLSVWIDQSGIEAATSWSGEIVDAIDACKALVVMLSPSSVASKNVAREVALAFDKDKKILPLDLEPVSLSRDLQYHLAGIQRTPMTNIDSIIRALAKMGLEATSAPKLTLVKDSDYGRKSLMILPFEDLSPTADNQWFADGIVSELISALSNVKALKVADQQATKDYKRYKGTLPFYAKEMNIRYFVQGDVRKFGDTIKITSRLLDIDTGDHLWQDTKKGTMSDVFEIQEEVARKVTDGLNIILTSEEKKKLAERGTENAEAYELFLKANEYFRRNTKEGFQLAAQLYSEAIRLDPQYAGAYSGKANALASLYRNYTADPCILEEGLALVKEALRLKPDLWFAYSPLSLILMLQGKLEEAEQTAIEYIQKAPEDYLSHFALGFFYSDTGQYSKAITSFEESLKLKPDNLPTLVNTAICCNGAKEFEKRKYWALAAIPLSEKHQKLIPEDESKRVYHVLLLHYACRDAEFKSAVLKLEDVRDGLSLYNTASLHCTLGDYSSGLRVFRKALEAGFRDMLTIKEFLTDEESLGTLRDTPEWEEVKQMVENIDREAEMKAMKD